MGLFVHRGMVCPPLAAFLAVLLLGGCTFIAPGPSPVVAMPADVWQAPLPHEGSEVKLTDWWGQFDDPVLLQLVTTAAATHPNLQRALAAIQEARAALGVRQADGQPKADLTATNLRTGNRTGPTPATAASILPEATVYTATGDAKWELDLFGGIRQAELAATARLAGRAHNWHEARITLAAEVAGRYVNHRACRQLHAIQAREVASRQTTLRLTGLAVEAGLQAPLDRHLAEARLSETVAALTAQEALCDTAVKALVSLTGLTESILRLLLADERAGIPRPAAFTVTTLPADLLAQRPDLAALERDLVAAGADLGVAEANRWPRLTLLGNITLSARYMTHAAMTTQPWSLGPSLALPLLDGGARRARVDEAQARYEQAQARYLGAVRTAVEEVETALVNLDSIRRRVDEAHAVTAHQAAHYQTTAGLWRAGGASLLALEESQRAALNAERAETVLQREQVQAWITLYKALGGGWQGA
ncbi:MAG: efflux transporter outer membrane subunit [Magnetococcus sp. DMHC-8]